MLFLKTKSTDLQRNKNTFVFLKNIKIYLVNLKGQKFYHILGLQCNEIRNNQNLKLLNSLKMLKYS